MSQVRSISGIDQELWDQAKEEYDSVSNRIKELLDQDLRTGEDDERGCQILKKSDLTSKQIKVARDLMTNGGTEKNASQLGNVLREHFSDRDYRKKCRKAIINNERVPFKENGKGIKSVETSCPDCEASISLQGLRVNEFECPNCDLKLFDLSN